MPGWYPCCREECANCTGNMPDDIEVTIANVVDGVCGDCDDYWNDAFVLDINAAPEDCSYLYRDFVYSGCMNSFGTNIPQISLDYNDTGGGDTEIRVIVAIGAENITFVKPYVAPAKAVCEPAGPIAIPLSNDSSGANCDWSGATCTIDAAP